MKAILLSIGLILITLTLDASNYIVASRNSLNIREGAGTKYGIIGKISPKDTVNVIEIESYWAKIKYQNKEAYVSSKYIIPIRSNKKKSAKEFFQGIGALFNQGPISYLPLLIISTLLITLLLRNIFSKHHYLTRLIIGYIGIMGICAMELIFFLGYFGEPWFCFPDNVGWVWSIINFILYGFVLLQQIRLGLDIIEEMSCDKSLNLQVGVYSYIVVAILGIIFWLANVDMTYYLFGGLIVAQIIQVIINFRLIKHFLRAFMISLLFIIVSLTVIVSSIYFILMLICIIIFFSILHAVFSQETRKVIYYN